MASSAQICHLCTIGLASSNDQLSKFFTHYIGGIDIDVPVHCNGSKVYIYIYLVECTLNTLSIYFSLTFRSHATKPHKVHGCPPHHIIHTTLTEKKDKSPKTRSSRFLFLRCCVVHVPTSCIVVVLVI